jgi:hypothetical protein
MMSITQRVSLAAAAIFLLSQGTVLAQINLVTSRPALGGTDFIDWSVLGTPVHNVNTPFNILSNNNLSVNVNQAASPAQRRDQGNGWVGNFSPGDALLYTGFEITGGNGPITMNFGASVSAFGLNIQEAVFGTFVARLTFFDASNNQVGTVTENGNSTECR